MTDSQESSPLVSSAAEPLQLGAPLSRWLLLLTAIIQLISPTLIPFQGSRDDPPIVPPGPFFSIWGLVTTGCLAVAAWGLPAGRASALPYRDVQLPLSVTQILFVCWLAAATSPGYYVFTLPIFLGMLAGLSISLRAVLEAKGSADAVTLGILGIVLGIYAGWSTAAIWLNLAAILPREMLQGGSGVTVQAVLIGAAVVSAATGSYLLRGNVAYALAASWALVGVTISSVNTGLVPVAVTSGFGLLVVGSLTAFRRMGV
jgi:hypothetical protein